MYDIPLHEEYTFCKYLDKLFPRATDSKVQKGNKIPKEAVAHLRKNKLVEGRASNLYLAAPLAQSDDDKAKYIKNKGFDNKYYQDLIVNYIQQFGGANKQQIRVLLFDKLPDTMSPEQKDRIILSFLTQLRKKSVITRDSESKQRSRWILVNEKENG